MRANGSSPASAHRGAVHKGRNDFATEVDLELERRISGELADRTGIAVHGEEFGGPSASSGTVWVLDPIDGTFNYAAGLPTAAILLCAGRGRRAGGRADLDAADRPQVLRGGRWSAAVQR